MTSNPFKHFDTPWTSNDIRRTRSVPVSRANSWINTGSSASVFSAFPLRLFFPPSRLSALGVGGRSWLRCSSAMRSSICCNSQSSTGIRRNLFHRAQRMSSSKHCQLTLGVFAISIRSVRVCLLLPRMVNMLVEPEPLLVVWLSRRGIEWVRCCNRLVWAPWPETLTSPGVSNISSRPSKPGSSMCHPLKKLWRGDVSRLIIT